MLRIKNEKNGLVRTVSEGDWKTIKNNPVTSNTWQVIEDMKGETPSEVIELKVNEMSIDQVKEKLTEMDISFRENSKDDTVREKLISALLKGTN